MHLLLPLLPLLGFVLRTLQLALRVVSPFWLLGLCLISLSGRALSVLAQSGWYQARRNLVLAGLILSASCYASPVRAQCVALEASAPLPTTVQADQCFELQGGNVLTDHYVIAGQLYVKAGRSATLAQRASLTVNAGECVVLHGHSGSGKSTLLRSLYANYLPDEGLEVLRATLESDHKRGVR